MILSKEPRVRIPFPPPVEKYSSGRRGAPAKGVGRETGARVRISPSPPDLFSMYQVQNQRPQTLSFRMLCNDRIFARDIYITGHKMSYSVGSQNIDTKHL